MMGQGWHLPLKKHRFLEHSVVATIAIQDILSNSFVLMLSKIAVVALNGLKSTMALVWKSQYTLNVEAGWWAEAPGTTAACLLWGACRGVFLLWDPS